jgi:hypothetical protein
MYDYEKKLLYILLMLPSVIDKSFEEFERCLSTRKVISYVLKTQKLVGIHNPKEQDEESDNLKE